MKDTLTPLRQTLSRWMRLFRRDAHDLSTEQGRSAERERRMRLTVLISSVSRVVGIITSFVMVPILIGFLGADLYGVWLTVYSLAAWFNVIQVGVSPGLLNELSSLDTQVERVQARKLVSAAFAVQSLLAVCVLCLAVIAWNWIPWQRVFNTTLPEQAHSARLVVAWLALLFVIRLPLDLSYVLIVSHQEGYKSAAIQLIGGIVSTAMVLLYVYHGQREILWLAILTEVGSLGALFVSLFVAFRPRPHLIPAPPFLEAGAVRRLSSVGGHFMAISIAGLIMTSTDNLVLSYFLGPSAVTPYRMTYMLTQFPIAAILMLLDSAWPAYAEATNKGDIVWLRATHRRFVKISAVMVTCSAAFWVSFGQEVVHWWSGGKVLPSQALVVALTSVSSAQGLLLCHGRLLTATGAIRYNAWTSFASTLVNLIASIMLVQWIGDVGVALGTLVGIVACAWLLIPLASRQLKHLEAKFHGTN